MTMKIGDLARLTATTPPTIRYYEEIALLPQPARQEGGQRRYGGDDVERLTFIRQCREFGFSIQQIRALITLNGDSERSCLDARSIASSHLDAVRVKLTELKQLERTLANFVDRCDQVCAGGPGKDCVILQDLADPAAARGKRNGLR